MNEEEKMITRYLLGEVSDGDRTALEERFFNDRRSFENVLRTETDLVDAYVRNQLPDSTRAQFERFYLAHPDRRDRVKVAAALLRRVDQKEASMSAAEHHDSISFWRRLMLELRGRVLIWQVSLVVAVLVIWVVVFWLAGESKRQRSELADALAAHRVDEEHAADLEKQLADERKRSEALTAELEKRQQQESEQESVGSSPTQSVATLLLTLGGVRGSDPGRPPTLVIPRVAALVRLELRLKTVDYPSYRATLRSAGGEEILDWQRLKPAPTKSGARLILNGPASRFASGDYILTLKGITQTGELDDVSVSTFRVKKEN